MTALTVEFMPLAVAFRNSATYSHTLRKPKMLRHSRHPLVETFPVLTPYVVGNEKLFELVAVSGNGGQQDVIHVTVTKKTICE